jgi:urease accessory protein
MKITRTFLTLLLLLSSSMAFAHSGEGAGGGFISGFTHPLYGWDHVAAMVAVGIWGAFLGRPAIWVLPVVFPLVMAFGGVLGILGIPVPGIEAGIAISSIVIGLLIALAMRTPLWVAAIIVGLFAIFHGHAHGTELPGSVNPLAYSIGFVLATGLLHLAGIAFGELMRLPKGEWIVRAGGVLIALAGVGFLTGML